MKKGMILSVYRTGANATNGLTSGNVDSITLVGDGVPELFEPSVKAPLMYLLTGPVGQLVISPEPNLNGLSFGGNYGVTSDSRFALLLYKMIGNPTSPPLMIFDRHEGKMIVEDRWNHAFLTLHFRSGEKEWSQQVVAMVQDSVCIDAAGDMIASMEYDNMQRIDQGSDTWETPCGSVNVWAGTSKPISRRFYEQLQEVGMPSHEVRSKLFAAWQSIFEQPEHSAA